MFAFHNYKATTTQKKQFDNIKRSRYQIRRIWNFKGTVYMNSEVFVDIF